MRVYILQHEHETDDTVTDVKLIGVYGTEREAQAAQERLSAAPGFRDYRDGFSIDAYTLDQDHWTDGFRTIRSKEDDRRAKTAAARSKPGLLA